MNVLIIIVAAAISFIIGAVWFSPKVFYDEYASILNRSEEDIKETMEKFKPHVSFPFALISEVVIATIIYYLTMINSTINDIYLVLLIALVVCFSNIKTNIFSYNNLKLYLIINGQIFVSIVGMGSLIILFT